ncbi:MAG: PspC domain-containing protein [Candidatus Nanosalina sp.]
MTRLYRSEEDRILGGVCGGIAEIYDLDPSIVRLVTLLLILGGAPLILYLAAWLIIPPKSEVEDQLDEKSIPEKDENEEEPVQDQESDVESTEEDSEDSGE